MATQQLRPQQGGCGARSREFPAPSGSAISELNGNPPNPNLDILMQKIERVIETILFQSRWLLAPIYLGLVVCLLLLMVHFGHELFNFVLKVPTANESDVILGTLSLIDLAFTGNLVVIVIFSGYENFVSKIETGQVIGRIGWPRSTSAVSNRNW